MTKENPIEVAMGCDQNYFCGLIVTAVTMAKNCSVNETLCFNFLDGGISSDGKTEIENKCRLVHPLCKFKWINVNAAQFDGFPKFLDKGKMTYARLLLPDLLPTCRHVIYCDVDFLWLANVAELWALRADKVLLQSVADGAYDHRNNEEQWFSSHGYTFDASHYFCAGMCMLNLEIMRQEGLSKKLLSFIENNPDIKAHDQTALNIMCYGRNDVRMLPLNWQLRTVPPIKYDTNLLPAIHFAADTPWRVLNFTCLLTDFELLWFKASANINNESVWSALRRYYSPFKIIQARLIYLVATRMPLGIPLLHTLMKVLSPTKDFKVLIPFLTQAKIPAAWHYV